MKPYYTKLEDGSAIVEWVSPDVRFGINIELNPEESGWFFVTKDFSKNESGLLPPELQRLLTPLAPDSLKAGDLSLPESVKVENALPAVSG